MHIDMYNTVYMHAYPIYSHAHSHHALRTWNGHIKQVLWMQKWYLTVLCVFTLHFMLLMETRTKVHMHSLYWQYMNIFGSTSDLVELYFIAVSSLSVTS